MVTRSTCWHWIFFIIAALLAPQVNAESVSIDIVANRVSASPALYFRSGDSSLGLLEDILPCGGSDVWQLNTQEVPNYGFGPATMWFCVVVKNSSDTALDRYVEIQNPVLDEVIMYQVSSQDKLLARLRTGDRYGMSERPEDHYNLLLPFRIAAGEIQTLYFRVMTDGSLQLPIVFWAPKDLYKKDQLSLLGFGVLFGVLVVMSIYNLFAFFMLQDRVFLYYSAFAISLALFEASINGFGNQYLWPESAWWRVHSVSLFVPLMVGFGCLFARSFLQLKLSHRKLYRLLGLMFHLEALCALLSLFLPYVYTIQVSAAMAAPVGAIAVVVGIYRWQSGYIAARYFILAWSLFLLSGLAYAASKFGLMPRSTMTEHTMQVGAMLGSIVSAFALTDRVNSQRLAYMEAQKSALLMQKAVKQDLEETVADRTRTLQQTLTQLEAANEQLQSLSTMDGLTGIRNRRFFDEKLEREWSRAIRNDAVISLLAIDIDYFKRFNDNYGHLLGDECLKHVAKVITDCVSRPSDAVARYGGEEFMVILPETEQGGALYIAEEIRQAVEERSFYHQESVYRLTVSVGVSTVTPMHGEPAESLVSQADRGLYQSKKRGRNCVTAF
ncbi:MAG: sensor domain-containing diguanylate cyclase [Pseudomonadales bacterium]|nr:sensor domain-containing diguanylate cyclase [Pseudomonadales bacterium]